MIAAIPAFIVAAQLGRATHEEKSGGLPQLNPADFAPQLVWLAITFIVALPRPRPGGPAAHRRGDRGAPRPRAARSRCRRALQGETDAALAAYEKRLSEARQKASSMAKDMRERSRLRPTRSAPASRASSRPSSPTRKRASPPPRPKRWRASTRSRPRPRARSSASCSARTSAPPRSRRCCSPPPSDRRPVRTVCSSIRRSRLLGDDRVLRVHRPCSIYYKVPGMVTKGARCPRRRIRARARRGAPAAR